MPEGTSNTPSPAPTAPASAPAPAPAPQPSGSEPLWQGLSEEFLSDDNPPAEPTPDLGEPTPTEPVAPKPDEPTPSPEPTPAPTPAPTPTPTPSPVPQPTPQPTPTPPVEPVPVTPPQPPAPPQKTAEQLAEEHKAARMKAEEQLVNLYAIPVEEAEALNVSPSQHLPKFAARLHMQVVENVLGMMQQILPAAIVQVSEQQRTVQEKTKAFFDAWPHLNKPELHPHVARIATEYRRNNPSVGEADAVREIGLLASAVLRVAPIEPTPAPGTTPPAPPAPTPFTPAAGGTGVPSGPKGSPKPGVWGQIAEEFLEEDKG